MLITIAAKAYYDIIKLIFLMQDKLLRIWKGEPCHVAKAKIGKVIIHHGSFHSLKDNEFINDEVN